MTALILILAVCLIYSRSIKGDFLFDDHAILDMDFPRRNLVYEGLIDWDDPGNRASPPVSCVELMRTFTPRFKDGVRVFRDRSLRRALRSFFMEPRALTHIGYLWNWRLSGRMFMQPINNRGLDDYFNPFPWHAVNILLHLANTLLIFLLVGNLRPAVAWPAAFLFAFHPHQVAAVSYISGRAALQTTFFALCAAHICFIDAPALWLAPGIFLSILFASRSKEDGYAWTAFFLITFGGLHFYFG